MEGGRRQPVQNLDRWTSLTRHDPSAWPSDPFLPETRDHPDTERGNVMIRATGPGSDKLSASWVGDLAEPELSAVAGHLDP